MENYISRNSRDKARNERFKQNPKNSNVWDFWFYRNFIHRFCNNRIRKLMHTSDKGFELIKKFEGCELEAYQCAAGVWTIGYGHTKDVQEGDKWTEEKADFMLWRELDDEYEHYVNSLVTAPMNQSQFDSLISWTYNLGPNNLKKSSMLRVLNEGKYDEVPAQMKRWNKAKGKVLAGLTRRREAEALMFEGKSWEHI
jgi:lysozyme